MKNVHFATGIKLDFEISGICGYGKTGQVWVIFLYLITNNLSPKHLDSTIQHFLEDMIILNIPISA